MPTRLWLLLLTVAILYPGVAKAQSVDTDKLLALYRAEGFEQTPGVQARAFLRELWQATGAPGISAAVAVDGRIRFSEGIGYADLEHAVPATRSTVYNIGSVSKAISAVAVMQLVEADKVGLDDPIQRYVPSFPAKAATITVRHLLTHTSGIRHYRDTDFPDASPFNMNWRPYGSVADAMGIFKDDPLVVPPGSAYFYTSYGTNLLQGIVETASGLDFDDYLQRHLFAPAGMTQSGLDHVRRIVPHRARGYLLDGGETSNHPWEDVSYKWAGGGMISTPEDLVRLGLSLLSGRLMKPETVAEMFRSQLGEDILDARRDPPEPLRWEQGLGWRVRKDKAGRDFVNQCGDVKGFNACLIIYVDEGLVAATADNADVLGFRPALVLADLFRRAASEAAD